jgi:hypothetical protein
MIARALRSTGRKKAEGSKPELGEASWRESKMAGGRRRRIVYRARRVRLERFAARFFFAPG